MTLRWKNCSYLMLLIFLAGLFFNTQIARSDGSLSLDTIQTGSSQKNMQVATATPTPQIVNSSSKTSPANAISPQHNPGLIAGGIIILAVITFGFIRSIRKG